MRYQKQIVEGNAVIMDTLKTTKTNRIEWIDIAKGITILLVIIGHSVSDIERAIIFSFHMPLFFILSSVTARVSTNSDEFLKNTGKAFRHLVLTALAIYFLREIVLAVMDCIQNSSSFLDTIIYRGSISINTLVYSSGAMGEVNGASIWALGIPWFLIALFFGRTLFDYLHMRLSKKAFCSVIVLCSILGVILGYVQWLPFSFDIALAIQPFFLFGLWLKRFVWEKRAIPTLLISLMVWGLLFTVTWLYSGSHLELAPRNYTLFPLCFVCAIAGTMSISSLSWFISKVNYVNEPIKYIGKHSLILLWIHCYDGAFENVYNVTDTPLVNGLIRTGIDLVVFVFVMLAREEIRTPIKKLFSKCVGRIKNNLTVYALFVGGFLMRWFYVLYTSIYDRQHDVGTFDGDGHYGYINYIMNNGLLPDFDPTTKFQFAHPPLHHMICSGWIKIMTNVFGASFEEAAESIQYLTLVYSTVLMYVAYRIFKRLKLEGLPLYVAMAVVCFHPAFILLSGCTNNDMLSVMLMAASLMFAIKWYQDERWRDLLLSALTVGLSLMTKSTAALVVAPIAILIIVKLVKKIKEHDIKRTIMQIISYGFISLPIGMWFHIYNLIRWNVPLFFVYPMPEGIPMHIEGIPVMERLFDFSPDQLSSVYQQWRAFNEAGEQISSNDFNPLIAALKTSAFGEYIKDHTFDPKPEYNVFAIILFYTGAVLAVGSFIYMIYNLIKKNGPVYIERLALGVFFIVMMISFYVTAFKYPFECTMDFRYIPLTALVGAFFLGLWTKQLTEKPRGETISVRDGMAYGIVCIVALFAISSVMMYVGLYAIYH